MKLIVFLAIFITSPLFAQFELTGLVEFEAAINEVNQRNQSSYGLGSVEFGGSHQISDKSSAEIIFLYEPGDSTVFEVDSGLINYVFSPGKLDLQAGKGYLPFGEFKTELISDSMVLEIAEINQTFVNLTYHLNFMEIDFWLTNSGTGKRANGENFGLKLSTGNSERSLQWNAFYAMQNDITISGGLSSLSSNRKVTGSIIGLDFKYMDASLSWEYFFTDQSFESGVLSFKGEGAKPNVYSIEFGLASSFMDKDTNYSIRYECTHESVALELYHRKLIIGLNLKLNDNLLFAVEGILNRDFSKEDGGSNREDKGLLTQLAYNF